MGTDPHGPVPLCLMLTDGGRHHTRLSFGKLATAHVRVDTHSTRPGQAFRDVKRIAFVLLFNNLRNARDSEQTMLLLVHQKLLKTGV